MGKGWFSAGFTMFVFCKEAAALGFQSISMFVIRGSFFVIREGGALPGASYLWGFMLQFSYFHISGFSGFRKIFKK